MTKKSISFDAMVHFFMKRYGELMDTFKDLDQFLARHKVFI
jgi:hypothetical protein